STAASAASCSAACLRAISNNCFAASRDIFHSPQAASVGGLFLGLFRPAPGICHCLFVVAVLKLAVAKFDSWPSVHVRKGHTVALFSLLPTAIGTILDAVHWRVSASALTERRSRAPRSNRDSVMVEQSSPRRICINCA